MSTKQLNKCAELMGKLVLNKKEYKVYMKKKRFLEFFKRPSKNSLKRFIKFLKQYPTKINETFDWKIKSKS